jgi:hypothetical protein
LSSLTQLLRSLKPERQPGVYAFVVAPANSDIASLRPIASFHEAEGMTLIVDEAQALTAGLPVRFRAAWLVLNVTSDLHDVGLTAAVSTTLADAGIACNVVAAVHHDHLFVPVESADAALDTLRALKAGAAAG